MLKLKRLCSLLLIAVLILSSSAMVYADTKPTQNQENQNIPETCWNGADYACDCAGCIVEEIRSLPYYVPQLELVMVNDEDEVIGYVIFSKIHLGGNHLDELLSLNPVAVKTELQRQHISKELIEAGFEKAKSMGYKAVLVEGNPMNYRNRGFVTSADFGIVAGESVGLPAPECLMVKELEENALDKISGVYEYTDYKTLCK